MDSLPSARDKTERKESPLVTTRQHYACLFYYALIHDAQYYNSKRFIFVPTLHFEIEREKYLEVWLSNLYINV